MDGRSKLLDEGVQYRLMIFFNKNIGLYYLAGSMDHIEENKKIYGMPPSLAQQKSKTGAVVSHSSFFMELYLSRFILFKAPYSSDIFFYPRKA